jgi:hypothetical protein
MKCHACWRESVGRCKSCGLGYCVLHGHEYCRRCATAIAPGGGRERGIRVRLFTPPAADWEPTDPLEDPEEPEEQEEPTEPVKPPPPACSQCGGPPERNCERCQELYCAAHAGRPGMCAGCTRAAVKSAWLMLGLLLFLLLVVALLYLAERWQQG